MHPHSCVYTLGTLCFLSMIHFIKEEVYFALLQVQLTGGAGGGGGSIGVNQITDLKNGRFSVTYVAPSSGTWEIWARTGNDATQHKIGTLVVAA